VANLFVLTNLLHAANYLAASGSYSHFRVIKNAALLIYVLVNSVHWPLTCGCVSMCLI